MKNGFIKVAAGSVAVSVADVKHNVQQIKERIAQADAAGVNLLVLPELCVTGATCGDLFLTRKLQQATDEGVLDIAKATEGKYPVVVAGAPFTYGGMLFNCAVVFHNGEILGVVPKKYLPNHGASYEKRWFTSGDVLGDDGVHNLHFPGRQYTFIRPGMIFSCEELPEFSFGVEIGEDLWTTDPASRMMATHGATIIANPSASAESVGVADYRRMLVQSTSARLMCGYVCANADPTESTQDAVCSRHHLIAENGKLLAENKPFGTCDLLISEIDVQRLADERLRNSQWTGPAVWDDLFSQKVQKTKLTRHFDANPFVPDDADMDARAESILQIQAHGLARRLDLTWSKKAVVGISGGLDSTLALLVMVRAMDLLGRPHSDVLAVTMPCFGTSKRTKNNAITLCNELGVELQEVNIMAAVQQHFKDIGHDPSVLDVTYENSQARERTQVLMDIANQCGGLVVGTGDLSELALGWATYNGDHMSMYGVNGDVPKTLVRVVVRYEAMRAHEALRDVLLDILDTPVSPELLPADDKGQIAQKTEDLVGPYELHDFFLFHTVRSGFTPSKIFRLAQHVFAGVYSDAVILHWLRTFTRRFFNQQFKRSCIPDGPKVGSVALSPRGDWRMPSDASSKVWLDEIAELEKADLLK